MSHIASFFDHVFLDGPDGGTFLHPRSVEGNVARSRTPRKLKLGKLSAVVRWQGIDGYTHDMLYICMYIDIYIYTLSITHKVNKS